jgi:glycerophosphoryl diester phosphodiesterase
LSEHGNLADIKMPEIIAHRGASRQRPENTVAAFARARELGAGWVELDVRLTADEELAVHHDGVLADGRPVGSVAASELPAGVPLLAEALEACAGMGVHIEIKNEPGVPGYRPDGSTADIVAAALGPANRHRFAGPTVISSFDLVTVDRARRVRLETAWLTMSADDATLDTLLAHCHHRLHPWDGAVTEAVVVACRARAVAVNVWTVDDPECIRQLAAWGVDGICTNVPDVAVAALRDSSRP